MPLMGKLVRLRRETDDDRELFLDLRNDMATQGWNQALPPDFTEKMEQQRYEKREYSLDREDARFVIERLDSGDAIGYISYSGVRPRHEATIGISTLQSVWGSGLAFDAQETLLGFLFHELGLWVVRLWTNSANSRGMKLASRSGFRVGLSQRESCFKGGVLCDNVMMDLLREEFYARHPELEDLMPPL
jgi:RimJ/RimL family protein N-acetyltransferase